MPEMIICPSCDSQIPANSKFCLICGQRITRPVTKTKSELSLSQPDTNHSPPQLENEEFDWYRNDIPWAKEEPDSRNIPGPDTIPGGVTPSPPEPVESRDIIQKCCLSCGNQLNPGEKFCENCGTPVTTAPVAAQTVSPPPATCPRCGTAIVHGKMFCGKCGTPVTAAPVNAQPGPPSPVTCPRCGTAIVPGKKFCGKCGSAVSYSTQQPGFRQGNSCPRCGSPFEPGKKFCRNCGAKLS